MILSHSNFMVHSAAEQDGRHPELFCLRIEPDGATVASSPEMLLACEPLPLDVKFPNVGREIVDPSKEGTSVSLPVVQQVLKNMPGSTEMKFAALTDCDDMRVGFTTVDREKEQSVAGVPISRKYPLWRRVLSAAFGTCTHRVCFTRKHLLSLLKTMDDATGDKSNNALVFISFGGETDPAIFRVMNYRTQQRLIGVLRPVDVGDNWMRQSEWERKVMRPTIEKRRKDNG